MSWIVKYDTKTFSDIYNNVEDFLTDSEEFLGYFEENDTLEERSIKKTFYLLASRYANSPIVNYDEFQWKLKLWDIISDAGAEWQQKSKIQKELRHLNLQSGEAFVGNKMVHNSAFNPETPPVNDSTETLGYINNQNVSSKKKGKVEALADIWVMLRSDINKLYLDKFKKLFSISVKDERPVTYISEVGEDE